MENEKIESEDTESEVLENKEAEETDMKKKPKWSLKKKLIVGGGVVLGLILGAVALGSKNKTTAEQLTEKTDDDTAETEDKEVDDEDDEGKEPDSEKTEEQ